MFSFCFCFFSFFFIKVNFSLVFWDFSFFFRLVLDKQHTIITWTLFRMSLQQTQQHFEQATYKLKWPSNYGPARRLNRAIWPSLIKVPGRNLRATLVCKLFFQNTVGSVTKKSRSDDIMFFVKNQAKKMKKYQKQQKNWPEKLFW